MAKELPYFRFTAQEWQNGLISLEDYELKGLFIDLCAYYWVQDCSVTKAMLEKRFRNDKALLNQLFELGILKHEEKTDLAIINYLNEQFDVLSEKRKRRQDAGRKGGKQKSSNAKAKPKQNSSYKDKDKDKDNLLFIDISNESQLSEFEKIAFTFWKLFKKNLIDSGKAKTTILDKAKVQSWSNDIRLLVESDKATLEEIRLVWEFLNVDAFWKVNIQSTSKLREKFDALYLKAKSTINNKQQSAIDPVVELARKQRELYDIR